MGLLSLPKDGLAADEIPLLEQVVKFLQLEAGEFFEEPKILQHGDLFHDFSLLSSPQDC